MLTRREFLKKTAGGALAALALPGCLPEGFLAGGSTPDSTDPDLITNEIPSSGEEVPAVGIGMRNYRTEWAEDGIEAYRRTIEVFHERGGRVLDTAPSYGDSESVLGGILEDLGIREDLFLATKVDRRGREAGVRRMEDSLEKIGTDHVELMQVHNLRDAETQLATMREWREDGRVEHAGITTSRDSQYSELLRLMRAEEMDFVQVDYSLGNRTADEEILPLAREKGIAVMVNMPFGRGELFKTVEGRDLPGWADDFDADSWAQFFLKYVISHPAVTVVIPGTTEPGHARDNMGAAGGALPDPETRRRMETLYDRLRTGRQSKTVTSDA